MPVKKAPFHIEINPWNVSFTDHDGDGVRHASNGCRLVKKYSYAGAFIRETGPDVMTLGFEIELDRYIRGRIKRDELEREREKYVNRLRLVLKGSSYRIHSRISASIVENTWGSKAYREVYQLLRGRKPKN